MQYEMRILFVGSPNAPDGVLFMVVDQPILPFDSCDQRCRLPRNCRQEHHEHRTCRPQGNLKRFGVTDAETNVPGNFFGRA